MERGEVYSVRQCEEREADFRGGGHEGLEESVVVFGNGGGICNYCHRACSIEEAKFIPFGLHFILL